jgi:phage terminase large subunit GpA-like protein
MDAVTDRLVETIVVMSSAQVGKTSVIENIIGYFISQDPSPILVVQPTLEMGKTFSKDRLAPMLRDTPSLRGKVKDPRARDSGNTVMQKTFPGGHLTITGANSPAGLASRPIRVVLQDEVDRFPPSAGSEGDPVNLARRRTATFWNRKIILTSTPTIKGASRIEAAFEESDQRKFFVTCPHCEEPQTLKWSGVSWPEGQPENAVYACEHCGGVIEEKQKQSMLLNGYWRSTRESATAGFYINELYSPWRTWAEVAQDFLEAKKNPETLKTWVNTSLGETWEEAGEQVEGEGLMSRRESFDTDSIPEAVKLLTAGVDVQADRIEAQLVGWDEDNGAWILEQVIFWGNPSLPDPWDELDKYLLINRCGRKISCVCVDSGYLTQRVYEFVKPRTSRRIFACKGMSGSGRAAIAGRPKPVGRIKAMGVIVGVDTLKDAILSRLKLDQGIHFADTLDEEFFDQLTAEKVVTRYRKGFPVREWVKQRPRNEALDCLVYAWAAQIVLNPDWNTIKQSKTRKPERQKRDRSFVKNW